MSGEVSSFCRCIYQIFHKLSKSKQYIRHYLLFIIAVQHINKLYRIKGDRSQLASVVFRSIGIGHKID